MTTTEYAARTGKNRNLRSSRQAPLFGTRPACQEHPTVPAEHWTNEGRTGADVYARKVAADVCRRECPIRVACLEFALKTGQAGVWGGLSEIQRGSKPLVARVLKGLD